MGVVALEVLATSSLVSRLLEEHPCAWSDHAEQNGLGLTGIVAEEGAEEAMTSAFSVPRLKELV